MSSSGPDKYRLDIRCEIMRLTPDGSFTSDRLTVSDQVQVEVGGFLEIAAILGQFHDLADTIRRANATSGKRESEGLTKALG